MYDRKSQPFLDTDQIKTAVERIKSKLGELPETAIILGSGLGQFAESLTNAKSLSTKTIPGYPASTVSGHKGCWVVGACEQTPVLAVQGRVHGYEGLPHATVTFPIHLLAEVGVRNLIITNAAGGINRFYRPGDLMVIEDHINLTFKNPLFGSNNPDDGPRFPDMSAPIDREFVEIAIQEGVNLGLPIHRGVYMGVNGPTYETAAEIRMGERIGADAVGMSTIPEVIAATYRSLRVLGISCITNMATGISAHKLSHADVIRLADSVKKQFTKLIVAILKRVC
ncbi:MAG: purine-nucleoside phosphorylase [bacterium]